MLDVHQPVLGPDLLATALNRGGAHPAVHLDDRVVSYSELRDAISCYSQAYAAAGLGRGSAVAMLSSNRVEVLYAMGANAISGCRATPLHPLGSLDDHAYVLEHAEIGTLLYDPTRFEERAGELRKRLPDLALLALGPGGAGEDLTAAAARFTPAALVPPKVSPDDSGSLGFTGGTTGKPKGVVGTYRSAAALAQIQMLEWEWPAEIRFLLCTPLSHAAGAFWLPVLLRGGSFVVLPSFTPDSWLAAVEKHRVTATMLVPAMLYAILDHPDLDRRDVSSLETVFYGASPASPTRLREAIGRFGPVFFQFYGQSEVPMSVTVLRRAEHDPDDLDRLASCGRPVPWVHAALLDDDLNPVAPGEAGEICVRGSLVTDGYWKLPEATDALFAGGWLHTGDVAREDERGFWTIVDRKKDMIVSGGFNVFPREVEDVLARHPAVAAVAVIGVPDEKWGEAVKAVVVPRPGAVVDEAELIALARDAKGPVYAPKSVDVVDAIPLTPVGKPDKPALRERYWAGRGRRVG
ncbi:AMP-binding protein [Frankia sp. CNm7]|uniref:AMP-binding protein n=1 Tax=Frankia nepalensis TaxID=1836974 RepID=A0A937RBX8_9ACTN|nr:AMP-binding protein [Frankia nepalensis]MBL7498467.1 AMP-binding protein [Frankia nepalensis]MBL7509488.1 AMP-binding protein [Frankia nepalensis]MBL7520747.1 AMP-binding protein [Frankia nepalensis]MBL7629298.1 AMP-binding protein [Frankia nepalensis]